MCMNLLYETIEYKCSGCGNKNHFDLLNTNCQHCEAACAQEIAAAVMFEAGTDVLVFGKESSDTKYVNKANLRWHSTDATAFGATAIVVPVHNEFFDLLEPDEHKTTRKGSRYGKVIIGNQNKAIQEVLAELKHLAKPASYWPGSATRRRKPRNLVKGQLTIDDETEVKTLTSALQPDWNARTKSFLDNELFVDFE